jgi:hypothetical protein
MTYSIKPIFISALTGWRIGIYEDEQLIHHYATRTEANKVKESLERGIHQEEFAPSHAIREGFNKSHFDGVLRAKEWDDSQTA